MGTQTGADGAGSSAGAHGSAPTRSRARIWVNCDSIQRLASLPPRTECFIRVNGGVGGGHHDHVITCGPASKFGVPQEDLPKALQVAREKDIHIIGLHQHIGSGLTHTPTFMRAFDVLADVIRAHAAEMPHLQYADFGGGIGVAYRPGTPGMDMSELSTSVVKAFKSLIADTHRSLTLMLEPGRFPVAESGYLVTRVNTIKDTPYGRCYVGVDSGFNHLIRPTMYGSYHHISVIPADDGEHRGPTDAKQKYYVAGNVCESGDVFTRDSESHDNIAGARELPPVRVGDLLVLHTAGAYGYVMASEYNMRPRPAEVTIDVDDTPAAEAPAVAPKVTLARPAKTLAQLLAEHMGE